MEEGFAFSQALIHQRIASSGLRGFGIREFHTVAYALPVKYGQRVIAFVGGYAVVIGTVYRPFLSLVRGSDKCILRARILGSQNL